MTIHKTCQVVLACCLTVGAVVGILYGHGASTRALQEQEFSPYVDEEGNIQRPVDYKLRWSHIGGFAVASKEGETVSEIHDVYTQPESIEAFRRTGEFPDGAVLVKEVRETSADGLTTGHAAWSTNIKVWFVMVKDSTGRFPDNNIWGNGWGWALFEAGDPETNVTTNFRTSCLGCHVPAQETDWIYIQGYPELAVPAVGTSDD
ncbi:MAG: cytochrome P460 family protein [Pirellulaceae bacterium]